MHFPVIKRARMHSVGRPRARMHHACRFWMSVGSNHACSNRARACIMHADYSTVARARASCMQILHANSRCQLDQIMHKFVTPTQGVSENPVRVCKKLNDIRILRVRACAWMSIRDSRYVKLYMCCTTGRIILAVATWLVGL